MLIQSSLKTGIFKSISEFTIQKNTQPLGIGSFGTVRLAIHKYTKKKYAIKIICMDQKIQQNQFKLLKRQIKIHYDLNHPHIIRLQDVIQQNDKIYLIMQYANKGNLFNYQARKGKFSQIQSFEIFMQILSALNYMHNKKDVFHRDLKPENILLDHQMNVKLCDFGWATNQIKCKRTTFCGTYQYMSPQMIYEREYNYKIDIWALGVLLFQLNHCKAPFQALTFKEMKKKFEVGSYEININLSQELKNLIKVLLQFDPECRPDLNCIYKSDWIIKMKMQIDEKAILQSVQKAQLIKQNKRRLHNSCNFNNEYQNQTTIQQVDKKIHQKFDFNRIFIENNSFKMTKITSKQQKNDQLSIIHQGKKSKSNQKHILTRNKHKKCRTLQEQNVLISKKQCNTKKLLSQFTEKQNDIIPSYCQYLTKTKQFKKPINFEQKQNEILKYKRYKQQKLTKKFKNNEWYNLQTSNNNNCNNTLLRINSLSNNNMKKNCVKQVQNIKDAKNVKNVKNDKYNILEKDHESLSLLNNEIRNILTNSLVFDSSTKKINKIV